MNEEIKALIEREYIERRFEISQKGIEYFNKKKGIHNVVGVDPAWLSVFNDAYEIGYTDALSLFRWRKVSEDHFSKVEKVLIKVMCYFPNGHKCIRYTTGVIFNQERHSLDDDFIEKIASHHEIIEWMPIPEGGNDE